MNPVHVHLALNHVVILAALFSVVLLLFGLILTERILVRAALIGFVFSALVAIPVFLTGEVAEEAVENLPGVTHDIVHSHEEAAEFSIWLIEILGLLSLITIFSREKYQHVLVMITVVFSVFATGALIYTGLEGGKIRHSEIREEPFEILLPDDSHD